MALENWRLQAPSSTTMYILLAQGRLRPKSAKTMFVLSHLLKCHGDDCDVLDKNSVYMGVKGP